MSKKIKIILAASVSVLLVIAVAVAAGIVTASSAAKQTGEETRKDMKASFRKDLPEYEDMLVTLEDCFEYPEYCVILNGDQPMVNVNYENVTVEEEQIAEELEEFAESTGTEVIYVDEDAIYFKREFRSGLGKISEANFVIRRDGQKPDGENTQKIADTWYYTEYEVE